MPPKPRAPPRHGGQKGLEVPVPGSLGGAGPTGSPPAPRPAPRWVFPSRGGRREAGRGRGRFGGLGRPPPLALRLPPPGTVAPRTPAGVIRTPGGGRPGAPHQRARGRAGFEGPPAERHHPSHHLPKPAVPSRPAAEAAPQKQMGVCVSFPYLSAGPGEPRRGGCWIWLVLSRRVPQQKLPPAEAGAGAGAGEPGCTPRPGSAAHPGPCLYVERRVI